MEQVLKPEAQGNVAVEPVEWRCDECDCTSYARMDERKPNGGFGPGPLVRCVNCKKVHSVPASSIASLSERLAEARAQSDRFCDKYLAALKRAEAAEAKLAEAREIIEPFADWPVLDAYENTNFVDCTFRAGDFRRARAFLDATSGAKKGTMA